MIAHSKDPVAHMCHMLFEQLCKITFESLQEVSFFEISA